MRMLWVAKVKVEKDDGGVSSQWLIRMLAVAGGVFAGCMSHGEWW